MEVIRTNSEQSGTDFKYAARGRCSIGKSGDCKTWHSIPCVSAKGGINKGGRYNITYAPGE